MIKPTTTIIIKSINFEDMS